LIKVISYIRRNPKLTHEEFREYWSNVHVPLVRSKLPGLRLYRGGFPVSAPGRQLDADAIVELGFADFETMERELNSPEFLAPERQASSAHLLDLSCDLKTVVVEEIDVT
jgi:uncharacterized protein (TIGR02118 family)